MASDKKASEAEIKAREAKVALDKKERAAQAAAAAKKTRVRACHRGGPRETGVDPDSA